MAASMLAAGRLAKGMGRAGASMPVVISMRVTGGMTPAMVVGAAVMLLESSTKVGSKANLKLH